MARWREYNTLVGRVPRIGGVSVLSGGAEAEPSSRMSDGIVDIIVG